MGRYVVVLAGIALIVGLTSGDPIDAAALESCLGVTPTLVGTAADDTLVGGPGDDVILGLQGNDLIIGQGGNDIICGGNGRDTLIGAYGDDQLFGENGEDVLIGGPGGDRLDGGHGADVIYGTQGDDVILGSEGGDRLGGGSGSDRLVGGHGADRIIGGLDADDADGGLGDDHCEAELTLGCETVVGQQAPGLDITAVAEVEGAVRDSFAITVGASAENGLAFVGVYVNEALVAHRIFSPPLTTEFTETFQVDSSTLSNGQSQIAAVAVDVDGNDATSEPEQVTIENHLDAEGPSLLVELDEPTLLSALEPALRSSGVTVIEFRHTAQLEAPRPVPERVRALAAADGIEVLSGPTTITGGYYGRGLSLDDQLASYRASHEFGEPRITWLRLAEPVDPAALAAFGDTVSAVYDLPGRGGYDAGPEAVAVASAFTSGTPDKDATPPPFPGPISGADEQTDVAALAAAADAVDDRRVFWPSFGQLDTLEFDIHIDRPFWFDEVKHRVEFTHDLVWADGVLDGFSDPDQAYEHDLKVFGNGGIVGTRPFCFSLPWVGFNDAFYAYRSAGVEWSTNVPDDAWPYFDTDVSDECGIEDLSIGIVKPEQLDDGLAPGQAVSYFFTVEAGRGNPDTGDFSLSAQRLDRANDAVCFIIGHQNCTGLTGDGDGGFILRTAGEAIPGITLPACFTWRWPPDGDQQNNEQAARCTGDSDADGWDDTVDCAPFDPAINPGAVDIPNDGIDQDCDGSDLVVGSGVIQATLVWDNDNDLDLHVLEPSGHRIWYSNPGPSPTGGLLDRDDNVFVCGVDSTPGGVENIFWADSSQPASGTYTVLVDVYASCGSAANWTLVVRVDGDVVLIESGDTEAQFNFSYP